jgi:hypothetical protein
MKTKTLKVIVRSAIANASSPFEAIKNIARELDENHVEYCVVGGVALSTYNYLRNTLDIDLLVSKKGLEVIRTNFIGRGYNYRPGSQKNLNYVGGIVRIPIDLLVEGDHEGSVVLSSPMGIREKRGGIWYLSLPKLIEFKLNAGRPQDIQDVLQLIHVNELDAQLGKELDEPARTHYYKLVE